MSTTENTNVKTEDAQPVTNKKQLGVGRVIMAVMIFVAALLLDLLLSELLSELPAVSSIVGVGLGLVKLVSGLIFAGAVLRAIFAAWKPESNHAKTAFTLTDSALRYILVIVGLFWGLAIVGVDVKALLAGAGVVALIIGFGAESLIADVITGVFMLFEHQYEVGDIIVVGDFRGTVTNIGIRTTSITDSGDNVKIINNSDLRNLINRSSNISYAVCDIAIPYQGYLHKAEKLLEEELLRIFRDNEAVFLQAPTYLGVQTMDYARDALVLRVSAQVKEENIYSAQRTLNRAILLAFEKADIPNPVTELKLYQK